MLLPYQKYELFEVGENGGFMLKLMVSNSCVAGSNPFGLLLLLKDQFILI